MFDFLTALQVVMRFAPTGKAIIDAARSNADIVSGLGKVAGPVLDQLTEIGKSLFPKAAKEIQLVGAAIASFDPNTVKWLQGCLNEFVEPSPGLVVDGIYGPKTRDAVVALQKQLGLEPDGVAGKITLGVIAAMAAGFKEVTGK